MQSGGVRVCTAVLTHLNVAFNVTCLQALFGRLVPKVKGKREFSTIQVRMLEKLGISKREPNAFSPEEMKIEVCQTGH